jgi:hypothetical protein
MDEGFSLSDEHKLDPLPPHPFDIGLMKGR